jgi:hypothetical protein
MTKEQTQILQKLRPFRRQGDNELIKIRTAHLRVGHEKKGFTKEYISRCLSPNSDYWNEDITNAALALYDQRKIEREAQIKSLK